MGVARLSKRPAQVHPGSYGCGGGSTPIECACRANSLLSEPRAAGLSLDSTSVVPCSSEEWGGSVRVDFWF